MEPSCGIETGMVIYCLEQLQVFLKKGNQVAKGLTLKWSKS